jgi:hypothetical protein
MQNNERINSLQVAVKSALRGNNAQIWTSLPGILQSVNLDAMTCEVQPAVQVMVYDKTGKGTFKNLPLCVDVPIQFIGGGGYTATFPMAAGDEGLISFSCRCIDAWWQSGGVQPQAELRMHDLSDGFFIPGFRSQARKLNNISATSAQLRSDDGTNYVDVNKNTGTVTLKAMAQIVLDAPVTHMTGTFSAAGGAGPTGVVTGDIHVSGTVTGDTDVVVAGKAVKNHVHTDPQGGNTGPF